MSKLPVISNERGSTGGYLALFLLVTLVTIGVLAAFQHDIEVEATYWINYFGLGWLVPVF